jgi:molybdenum cofactor synthesis domain-containing protein
VRPDAAVHSRGVLGAIGLPRSDADEVLAELRRLDAGVRGYVARRVAVVSTGAEVLGGEVSDTNAHVIAHHLEEGGFEVTATGAVPDDEDAILGRVLRAVSEGFGVVVTTGGVGAEDKDRTIEALQRADPALATAVLATYAVGHGRHVKPHVRVAVGTIAHARVIALPGPTREVGAALPVVVEGLASGWGNERFVEELAAVLRDTLRPPV